jgi:sn-glycerol 3-phosphate transport system substrate-binding protein
MSAMRTRTVATSLAAVALLAAACSSGESVQQAGEGDDAAEETEAPAPDTGGVDATEPPASDAAPADGGTAPADTASAGEAADTADTTAAPTTTEPAATTTVAPLADQPPCPVEALDAADGPVSITFWHAMTNELEASLVALTDEYNAGQDRVRVTLQNQTSYDSNMDKYIQSSQGSRPHLIQLPEYALQAFAQSDTFIPAGACLEAGGLDTSAFLDRALAAYQFEGIQWSMPFNISNPVLYYNKLMFEEAGLDPEDPPITLEELRSLSQQLVESGAAAAGLVLDSGPDSGGGWYLEQWFGRAGELYADNGNGRLAPATEVLYDNDLGVELLTFLQTLIADDYAVNVGDNPGGLDAFLKMADPEDPGAMTIATSAGLGSVLVALGGGIAPGLGPDDIGVGPMPGPSPEPSVQVGGASLWIVADKGDAEAAAAWDYITFLTSARSQSTWASQTGYVPVREDAVELDPLATVYTDDPRFRVAYDQLLARADDLAATSPVLGPMREVRVATSRAVASVFNGADVASSLADSAAESNALIESYNARN